MYDKKHVRHENSTIRGSFVFRAAITPFVLWYTKYSDSQSKMLSKKVWKFWFLLKNVQKFGFSVKKDDKKRKNMNTEYRIQETGGFVIDYCCVISGKTPGTRRHRFDQKRWRFHLLFSIYDLLFVTDFDQKRW